jgi:hypothetical protein
MTVNKHLNVKDRVSRQIEIGKPERHFGNITEKYKSKQGVGFVPITLFAVKWDDKDNIERGYMEEGLQKEEE